MRYKVEWGFGVPEWMPLKEGEKGGCVVVISDGEIVDVTVASRPNELSSAAYMAVRTIVGGTPATKAVLGCSNMFSYENPNFNMPPDGEYSFGWWHDAVTWATKGMPIYHEPPKCKIEDLRVGEPFIHGGSLCIMRSFGNVYTDGRSDYPVYDQYNESEIRAYMSSPSCEVQPLGAGGWFKVEVLP